jgi:hypothetical protein
MQKEKKVRKVTTEKSESFSFGKSGQKTIIQDSRRSRVVGTSTALEKAYYRLTTFPKAENIRPLSMLKKALAHIKREFIKNEDFEWANEQLKSLRQDLTVQGIREKFVLEVYETHARILLEHGDLNEFQQCKTMIQTLTYNTGALENLSDLPEVVVDRDIYGNDKNSSFCLHQSEEAADEFQAYGILYNLVQNAWGELTWSLALGNKASEDLSTASGCDDERPACLRGSSYRHALQVVKALIHNDYQSFFRLYENPPHLSAYLMDYLVRRVRNRAYERIIAAYRPTLSVEHFRETLYFQDLDETRRFLRDNGTVFINEQGGHPFWLDCKATQARITKKEGR